MSNKYYDSKVLIEDNTGVLVPLQGVKMIRHYGTQTDEIPFVTVETFGSPYIVEGKKVQISFSKSASTTFSTYQNIFTGYIARLDDDNDYSSGIVTFRARNSLSLITQRFLGLDKHYGDSTTLTYSPTIPEYAIPDSFNDVYSVFVDNVEISVNNWNYDFLTRKISLYKSYPTGSNITIYGHIDTSLKTIVEDILNAVPGVTYNTIIDSGTKLQTCFFPAELSRYNALRQLAEMYNYRLFADVDGNISFNPVKINTSTETATESEFETIEKQEINKSITKAIVFGATLQSKFYQRTDNTLDDFNDNSSGNNFGGGWTLSTDNALNTYAPAVYRTSFEKSNQGFKLNYTTVGGSISIDSTLSSDGSAVDLSSFTGIEIKYRATHPIRIFIDSADYLLPANNYQELTQIDFTDFSGSFADSAVTNISISTAVNATGEYFIDYIGFYPVSSLTVNSYLIDIPLKAESGTSGGEITLDLPFVKNIDTLGYIADGLIAFNGGGITQYGCTLAMPDIMAEIGDIVKITSGRNALLAEPFELIGFDFDITFNTGKISYLLQNPYTLSTINNIRGNDIVSISAGFSDGAFSIVTATGSSSSLPIEFSKNLIELIAESTYNYTLGMPKMEITQVSGSGTTVAVSFGTAIQYYDADFFAINNIINDWIYGIAGTSNVIVSVFDIDLSNIDKSDFAVNKIIQEPISYILGSSNQISIVFENDISSIDKSFFTVNKII